MLLFVVCHLFRCKLLVPDLDVSTEFELAVVIPSARSNFELRRALRDTWFGDLKRRFERRCVSVLLEYSRLLCIGRMRLLIRSLGMTIVFDCLIVFVLCLCLCVCLFCLFCVLLCLLLSLYLLL